MGYVIENHGDSLEREATRLIKSKFQNYELVWQTYIGNRGNDQMAFLPKYTDDLKRKNFAENSYTVLESAFLINHILESGIFAIKVIDFDKYLEFNKSFITVFALLGRMHDTVIKASDILGYDNTNLKDRIHKFYDARNIVLHGKKIPVNFNSFEFPIMPYLKTRVVTGTAWEDHHSLWNQVGNMESEFVEIKLSEFFNDFLSLINDEYAVFYHIIVAELKENKCELFFEHYPPEFFNIDPTETITASGTTNSGGFVDVYSFFKLGIKP